MILRIYTVVPTTFLQPADKMILPAMMGPMCVIGRGRPSGQGVKAGTSCLFVPSSLCSLLHRHYQGAGSRG